jgi:hypothetical protein
MLRKGGMRGWNKLGERLEGRDFCAALVAEERFGVRG